MYVTCSVASTAMHDAIVCTCRHVWVMQDAIWHAGYFVVTMSLFTSAGAAAAGRLGLLNSDSTSSAACAASSV
jgi:hypothetical protein